MTGKERPLTGHGRPGSKATGRERPQTGNKSTKKYSVAFKEDTITSEDKKPAGDFLNSAE